MTTSPKLKAQAWRILRLVGLTFLAAFIPLALHTHDGVTFASVEALVVSAGEATYRHFFPSDVALLKFIGALQTEAPAKAVEEVVQKSDPGYPPAVF